MSEEKSLKDYKNSSTHISVTDRIKKLMSVTGYTLARTNPPVNPQTLRQITPEHFFDLYFSMIDPKDFFFVQLGANDGSSRDRMHYYITKYNLSGILVEMQKDIFNKLKENYQNQSNLLFENVAIADTNGTQTYYRVKKSLVNERNFFETTAISSLDKEALKSRIKKRIPYVIENISDNLDDYVDTVEVEAVTLNELLDRNKVIKLDLLFIDCEGYDHKIINMIDFKACKPKVINYESCVLSDRDRQQCEELLESHGYHIFRHGNDTCAFLV